MTLFYQLNLYSQTEQRRLNLNLFDLGFFPKKTNHCYVLPPTYLYVLNCYSTVMSSAMFYPEYCDVGVCRSLSSYLFKYPLNYLVFCL